MTPHSDNTLQLQSLITINYNANNYRIHRGGGGGRSAQNSHDGKVGNIKYQQTFLMNQM